MESKGDTFVGSPVTTASPTPPHFQVLGTALAEGSGPWRVSVPAQMKLLLGFLLKCP